MPMNMFKRLFQNTANAALNKFIDKKVVLCVYKNSCMPQIGLYKVTIIPIDIKLQCSFFVAPGIGPAL